MNHMEPPSLCDECAGATKALAAAHGERQLVVTWCEHRSTLAVAHTICGEVRQYDLHGPMPIERARVLAQRISLMAPHIEPSFQ